MGPPQETSSGAGDLRGRGTPQGPPQGLGLRTTQHGLWVRCMHTYKYVRTNAHSHAHTRTHTRTNTHAHAHMHTHARTRMLPRLIWDPRAVGPPEPSPAPASPPHPQQRQPHEALPESSVQRQLQLKLQVDLGHSQQPGQGRPAAAAVTAGGWEQGQQSVQGGSHRSFTGVLKDAVVEHERACLLLAILLYSDAGSVSPC